MVLGNVFAFARARAMQAPLTFVGVSGCAAWYGVYDLAYLTTSTIIGHSTVGQSLGCRAGGHAAGCALGGAVVALRFPRAAISLAVSRGQFMQAPWSAALAVLGSSAGLGGLAGAVAQKSCGKRAPPASA